VRVEGPVGEQPPAAVEEALRALAADGLIERDSRGLARFPP
jgi:DNA-binding GntR family transcriptional regulator